MANRLTGDTNIDSIQALEEQIKEQRRPIIHLKRTQNSLLNISRLPPEILGDIFHQNVIPEGNFEGFENRSYNFLLVCHHWFQVASCTPELWSFWGNNLQDWAKRYLRYPAAPVDLVLDGVQFSRDTLDAPLRKALQDRAMADTVRRIHLVSEDPELPSSILSPLTADCEGIRSSSVESIIIYDDRWDPAVDVSDFFAHYRFPKLRNLELINCAISSWDLITSRTSVLTVLDLYFEDPTPNPTTAQLLSIFTSNPALRKVWLAGRTVPDDGGGTSSLQVPLHQLKELNLSGDFRNVVELLHRLDHARNTNITLCLREGVIGDISQILRPYLRDYLHHRDSSQNGLGLSVFRRDCAITLRVGNEGDFHPESAYTDSLMTITIFLSQSPPKDLLEKAILDLITEASREEIVYFRANSNSAVTEDIYAQLPNLRTLYLVTITLSAALPKPSVNEDGGLLPSLQHVVFDRLIADDGDWRPLTTFLSHRLSSGNRLNYLTIVDSSHMGPEVAEGIRSMVGEFRTEGLNELRAFHAYCDPSQG